MKYVIVGGSSGVGKQVAEDLVSNHGLVSVVVIDINEFDSPQRDSVLFIKCDISNVSLVESAINDLSTVLMV